ncbi:uncharacterized protein si:ch73-204p21.2 [Toxotes jaculatrix]|uniref:uncharacterized protein si:ch73-204p21.2 n=1 Tax=Toxotes jaculatrix TaxID=941984 RepID=UPI001B3ABA84|nr:uncharacterized protein si:ch73-204p21.2 [Toxotes jaculatrix]XP_040894165.1 uncharacterized protein si:ch73-204p21.2 [Toxotes jaculatrix]XP_040894175.1 uncharacterized protein si:ch73-204p21.2 [Toxotes jaculatrix]XP_040894184.1 uncharacterized protein si:ch73-204p21.2 [Toxotes jaculatrix]
MAAVGAGVTGSWFLSSGVVSFFILLLLLSIFLTALCSDCTRHSFELRDSETDKNPSALIRVVKLEETVVVRENPMISEIQNDEKENPITFTPWRSHLGAPQNNQDVRANGSAAVMETGGDSNASESNRGEENSVQFTLWRSHQRAPQNEEGSSFTPPDSEHIYHNIGGGRSMVDFSSPPTNQEPGQKGGGSARSAAADSSDTDGNSLYAQVSKKVRQAAPPVHTPEVGKVEGEEPSPPLPERRTEMEG